jgi:hypothetical protein
VGAGILRPGRRKTSSPATSARQPTVPSAASACRPAASA